MLESIKKNRKGILLMLVSSICSCFGQLFWKLSSANNILFLLIGFGLYGIGALIMIVAYRFGKLSILQPMLSMSYVLSLILAVVVLDEQYKITRCIGVLIIISGIVFIAGGDDAA